MGISVWAHDPAPRSHRSMHWGVSSVEENRAVPPLDVDADETVSFRYEIDENESPSHALVAVTSAVTGAAPTGIDPLGRHLDLEAMDAMLASTADESPFSASVVLTAEGLSLAVDAAEIVGVARRDVDGWSPDRS